MKFEWDDQKAVSNVATHGVSFGEATEVFYDPNALEGYDEEHSVDEDRFLIIGMSSRRLLFVVYAERKQDLIRIISHGKRYKESKKNMKEKQPTDDAFAFTVVEDDGEHVIIEVSEADYLREQTAGVAEEFLLKPGRHRMKRGGFLARHPELHIKERKQA